jgi:hypothetical protein
MPHLDRGYGRSPLIWRLCAKKQAYGLHYILGITREETMNVTEKQLQAIVDRINKLTKSPMTSYTKTENGVKANIGNYHLDFVYKGINLARMDNEGGGIQTILFGSTKSDLMYILRAYADGIEVGQKTK